MAGIILLFSATEDISSSLFTHSFIVMSPLALIFKWATKTKGNTSFEIAFKLEITHQHVFYLLFEKKLPGFDTKLAVEKYPFIDHFSSLWIEYLVVQWLIVYIMCWYFRYVDGRSMLIIIQGTIGCLQKTRAQYLHFWQS